MPYERVNIGRGHTEMHVLRDGVYSKGAVGALSFLAFVVRREENWGFLGPRLQWDCLVGEDGFEPLNLFAHHGHARG